MGTIHFDKLESQKENIQLLPQGHSATKLVSSASQPLSTVYDTRLAFEKQIHDELDELDDPLQLFIDYINWVFDTYSTPTTRQSGLPELLERCIEYCQSIETYKNDVRFVKLWFQYMDLFVAKWEDKREIFVHMMRSKVGDKLALFYERFVQLLIDDNRTGNAIDLLNVGIEKEARPVTRLKRIRQQLSNNLQLHGLSLEELPRIDSTFEIYGEVILGRRRTEINDRTNLANRIDGPRSSSKSPLETNKVEVFVDDGSDQENGNDNYLSGNPSFQSRSLKNKENQQEIMLLRPGVIIEPLKQGVLSSAKAIKKLPLFRDDIGRSGPVCKIIEVSGRKPEKVELNFDLVYPKNGEEYCIEEILAISRNCYYKIDKPNTKHSYEDSISVELETKRRKGLQVKSPEYQKITTTSILPLKGEMESDGHTGLSDGKSKSPTVTLFSKDAMNEVYSMFNQNYSESRNTSDNEDTTTNRFAIFENFTQEFTGRQLDDLTEVKNNSLPIDSHLSITPAREKQQDTKTPIYKSKLQDFMTPIQERTESTFKVLLSQDEETSAESRRKSIVSVNTAESSPFLTQPQRQMADGFGVHIVENPLSLKLRKELLESLQPPLSTYSTFYEYSQPLKMSSLLKRIQKVSKNMNKNPIVDFKKTNDLYCIRRELGEGGYATVYLAESSSGQLRALKVEKPASVWEFYILKQIERRVPDETILKSIINASALHYFQDESYLVLNYANQGTLLDLVNWEREKSGGALDECLCMFITVELMRVLECIHDVGIIHGDIKPDNCMIRFQKVSNLGKYNANRDHGWNNKGIYLIDFGRSFDLSLFPLGTKFKSNWKTDQQDCQEMRENRPWSYEADYYGLAGIIYSMLFGHYIETVKVNANKYQLKNSLKRYWQQDIWAPLFDLLINSGSHGSMLTSELRSYRERIEAFLEREASSKLKSIIQSLELDLERFKV